MIQFISSDYGGAGYHKKNDRRNSGGTLQQKEMKEKEKKEKKEKKREKKENKENKDHGTSWNIMEHRGTPLN